MTYAPSPSSHGLSRYVDCNSALALLGFILFVDVLRDIVEYVTEEKEDDERRKKRWAVGGGRWAAGDGRWTAYSGQPESDILTFITHGGADHLYDALPDIILPLMEGWQKVTSDERPAECLKQSVCEANRALAKEYGAAGRIFATLFTKVSSRALSGGDEELLRMAQTAAREGRRGYLCEAAFPTCHNVTAADSNRGGELNAIDAS